MKRQYISTAVTVSTVNDTISTTMIYFTSQMC